MSAATEVVRIGARGSKLALWQAERVASSLRARRASLAVEIVPIESHGDHHGALPVAALGVTGIFTREIEQALLEGRIDIAVHSLKDLPTTGPEGLIVAALLPRDDPRDVLVASTRRDAASSDGAAALAALPAAARIATSSLRRRAELLRHRPDLEIVELRGNVTTRLAKVERGDVGGVVLSYAGLLRLGLEPAGRAVLDPQLMLPAPAQGTIAVQVRAGDARVRTLVEPLDDAATRTCTTVERSLMAELEGGCRVPLGALARLDGGQVTLQARVVSADGKRMVEDEDRGPATDLAGLSHRLAMRLRRNGADAILQALRAAGIHRGSGGG